ncbi:hypothetical protein CHS0354_022834 [Potamilus streckersoni]|uniref:Reelin domain-containing protein n=1 Tax=Potamilus streckersoni TaxID=2493646 RepID=A0AAE0S1S5_9BIVA|nr:hypothetical protein CHS0354_022834 [Potamilus streckersoni]
MFGLLVKSNSLILFGTLLSCVHGRPNGAPEDACFYMTPRHLHPHTSRKVFPQSGDGFYNITVSSNTFRPDRPIKVTLWGPPFKGFMMVAAEEGAIDWPTGIFYPENRDAKTLYCLDRGDTVTHSNNSYKTEVSVLWYGPENTNLDQVQFIATIVVNITTYYTNIKSGFLTPDPNVAALRGQAGEGASSIADPWLTGNAASTRRGGANVWTQRLGAGRGIGGLGGGRSQWMDPLMWKKKR